MSQNNTNRDKKIRSILERSSNINAQNLQKYIDKKLSKEELHEVEKQLLNSDFATEALEGFENADFKVNITASTNQLNKEIKKYNKERGFYKTNYRYFYAAASVILIFGISFSLTRSLKKDEFVEQNTISDISQSKQTTNEETPILALNKDKELIEKLKNEEITEMKASRNEVKIENNRALNQDKSETEQDFSTSDIWITKKEKIENSADEIIPLDSFERTTTSPTTTNIEQLADDDYNFFSDNEQKNKSTRNQKSSTELLSDAMQSYENKKYTEANLLFDSYLIANPTNAQALYFGGMSYYDNDNYSKSIPLLEKFLIQKSNILYQKNHQDAEWYLANSYLKVKQKQKAKTILQKIAKSNSKYSNQAKSLLKN
ncbi:hypothetical protein Fleli_2512 [Bernardetia litoralis DSM 6794]|uniref:Uncharacterized protein n=1 Tax=Bernardetia litoralis (strain ATCC 23117 / DSM 6794 / NBRC 15988 / NCIMB 1366 / Fx l1 / Sio-4) TaxID=880071 RepID=I4ALP2_BERLS|nr:tetratricopeptide repeat protein [Bernardetia litoralis]AFM04877.1 hypothetical protein Fleli_2512 [Bernardetia litoralis DSM 6794]